MQLCVAGSFSAGLQLEMVVNAQFYNVLMLVGVWF